MADYKDICKVDRMSSIHQLNKINEKGTERQNFFPISIVQAIFDKTGIRLDTIISSFNYIFLPYKGTKESTRLQVVGLMRRKSLVVCYRDLDDNVIIEMYIGTDKGDDAWKNDSNWKNFEDWITDAVKDYLDNIDINNPNAILDAIKKYIEDYINSYLGDWLDENIKQKVDQIVNEYIEGLDIDQIIAVTINAWIEANRENINNQINTAVNNYLDTNLEPLVGEYFTAVKKYLEDNERVIANALARHEQAITDLQASTT